jgi:SpoVK/Ycf46/Vps4 family AAA+-type ATPase
MASDATEFEADLTLLMKARYPIVHISTFEEDRALNSIAKVAADMGSKILVWSTSKGISHSDGDAALPKDFVGKSGTPIAARTQAALADLAAAIELFEKTCLDPRNKENTYIFVLLDPYVYLVEKSANPIYRRKLRDFATDIRTKGLRASCLIIAPTATVPLELEKEVTVTDYPLPSRTEIADHIRAFFERLKKFKKVEIDESPAFLDSLVDASVGLTLVEIDNVVAKAAVNDRRIDKADLAEIFKQKQQIIRRSGILEYHDTQLLDIAQVGGLQAMKRWLDVRSTGFSQAAREFGIASPKGILVTGVPGCGKSWSAKCVAASWNLPLMRLDMGKVYSSWVGSSEHRMREAIKTCEAVSPCVLWIDEIEKSFPTLKGSVGDSGVSSRVFATFLTWMQEKTAPVFVFATANQIDNLPPEILRKGRFDEIFFVDLPDERERRQIIDIQLRRVKRNPVDFDIDRLVTLSGPDFLGPDIVLTGSELEAWTNDSLLEAYQRRGVDPISDLEMQDFETVVKRIVPLAKMRFEDVRRLREWAARHAISATMAIDAADTAPPGRRLELSA